MKLQRLASPENTFGNRPDTRNIRPAGKGQVQVRYPDFLGLGAQKSGSTWLHAAFQRHPDLWLPPVKEVHYFNAVHLSGAPGSAGRIALDRARIEKTAAAINAVRANTRLKRPAKKKRLDLLRLMEKRALNDKWYGRIFARAPKKAFCGEITPEYALLPEAGFEHILRLNPATKFLFILRDPIDRAWSQLRMIQRKQSATTAYTQEVLRNMGNQRFLARSDYMQTIVRVRKFVVRDRLLILWFDDVGKDPDQLLKTACLFLGADPARLRLEKADAPRNAGGGEELSPELHAQLKDILRPCYRRLLELNSDTVAHWIERHYGDAL